MKERVCGAGNTSESESEDGEDDDNCQTLTDIASGYTVATITGDFFGDAELAGECSPVLRIRPSDPYIFGPPGSGSDSQRYGVRILS